MTGTQDDIALDDDLETAGISLLVADESQYLKGGNRAWERIDVDTLRTNLDDLVSKVSSSLTPATPEKLGPFEVSSIEVAVTIGASGQVGILGTGVEAKAEASLTLTLTRRKL
jgi:hypothetical protein